MFGLFFFVFLENTFAVQSMTRQNNKHHNEIENLPGMEFNMKYSFEGIIIIFFLSNAYFWLSNSATN